jgi:hypothetical protein
MPEDVVNHPSHYNQGGLESLDIMKAFYGENALILWCFMNAAKYILRAPHKNGNEDIKKADFYLKYADKLSNDDRDRIKKIIQALKNVS